MPKTSSPIPVYIPWETFTRFVAHLHESKVPSQIDKSIMQHLPALTRGQIISALRFLELIDDDGSTSSGQLRSLVEAYGTDAWRQAVKEHVISAYDNIVGDLDLDNATPHQLDERFGAAVSKDQMRQKSERFYLSALSDAGITFSPHLVRKRQRSQVAKSRPKKRPARNAPNQQPAPTGAPGSTPLTAPVPNRIPEGMVSVPIPKPGSPSRMMLVPIDLDNDDCEMIGQMLDAIAKRLQKE